MRDIVLKLSVIVLLAGLTVGGWRSWHLSHDGQPLAGGMEGVARMELLTTADKASWVRAQVYSFNYQHQNQYQITVKYLDSREAMQKVIAGAEKPTLWSPESPVWITRANDVWKGQNKHDLVAMDDFSAFRVFLRSPLVFLTTRDKADVLRPYLSGSKPWTSVHDICSGKISLPFGKLRYSVADPIQSNSGAASVGMMLQEFEAAHDGAGNLQDIASQPKFADFIGTIESGAVVDSASRKGTGALADEYEHNPQSRDFIVTYENLAYAAAKRNPNFVVIYPSPTTVAEQSVAILNGPWVTPAQRQGADAFMTYVSRPESIKSGLKYTMRSAVSGAGADVEQRLSALRSRGFQASFVTEEAPPYLAINIAAAQWHKRVAG